MTKKQSKFNIDKEQLLVSDYEYALHVCYLKELESINDKIEDYKISCKKNKKVIHDSSGLDEILIFPRNDFINSLLRNRKIIMEKIHLLNQLKSIK